VAWGIKIMGMKKVLFRLIPGVFIVIFLLACKWKVKVVSEALTLKDESNTTPTTMPSLADDEALRRLDLPVIESDNEAYANDTTPDNNLIRFSENGAPSSDFKIQFLNPVTRKIEKEFDIIANNPYNKLKYPVLRKDEVNSCNVYDLSGMELNDETISYLTSYRKKPMNFKPEITLVSSTISPYKEGKNFTAIAYNLLAETLDLEPVGYRGTAIILDKAGNIIRRFEHLDVDINYQIVTEDGKYFCFIYGKALTEDGNPLTNQGFRLYSVENGELLFEEEVAEPQESFSSPTTIDGTSLIKVVSRFFTQENGKLVYYFKYRIFDPERRIVYTKIYERNELGNLFDITNKGMVFKNPDTDKTTIELYENHFMKKSF